MTVRLWLTAVLLSLGAAVLYAQSDDCPVDPRIAFSEAVAWCSELEPGALCYGNDAVLVTVDPDHPDVDASGWNGPGAVLPVEAITCLESRSGELVYGVAVGQYAAYRADEWRTAPAALVTFGAMELADASNWPPGAAVVTIAAEQGANLRSGPGSEYRVIRPAALGEPLLATGRSSDAGWVRVRLRGEQTAWVALSALDGVTADLPAAPEDAGVDAPLYAPFTAFQLATADNRSASSGTAASACAPRAPGGMLLQSVARVPLAFALNGVELVFDDTVYVRAPAGDRLVVAVLAGTAVVRTRGGTVDVPAGSQAVAAGEEDEAGEALVVRPYDPDMPTGLPLSLLPRVVWPAVDRSLVVTPRPASGGSPLTGMLVDEPCRITTGEGGANLRAGPGTEFPVLAVLGFRESAEPTGRAFGTDGGNWWRLAPDLWISGATTVTGGDCVSVPEVTPPPLPPPTRTPDGS